MQRGEKVCEKLVTNQALGWLEKDCNKPFEELNTLSKGGTVKRLFLCICAITCCFVLARTSAAVLYDRGGGLIYDDDLDITWLQDANYAAGSSYDNGSNDTDGEMTWQNAMHWVDQLKYGSYDDWRLPTTPADSFTAGNVGEMGHLYHDEGVKDYEQDPFFNIEDEYWTDTRMSTADYLVLTYNFSSGDYWSHDENVHKSAWAVRDGDVAPIPEPTTMLLLGSGIVGFAGTRIRKRFKK